MQKTKVDTAEGRLAELGGLEDTNNAEGRLAEFGGLEVRERGNQSTCSRRYESTAGPTFRRRAKCQKAPKSPTAAKPNCTIIEWMSMFDKTRSSLRRWFWERFGAPAGSFWQPWGMSWGLSGARDDNAEQEDS